MRLLTILLLAGFSTVALAQSPAPSPSLPAPPPGGVILTPEERQTLQAAVTKARQDPDVKAAGEKLRDAAKIANDLMAQKDPAVAPLIAKIESGMTPGAPRPHISQDEAMQLREARQFIKGTPEDEAWQQATTTYRAAMTKSMIAADPSVADILAKFPHSAGMPHAPAPAPAPPITSVATPSAAPSVSGSAKP